MAQIIYWVNERLAHGYRSTWTWIIGLDRDQWLVLLVATTVAGFLCMRGYSARK